MKEAEVTRTAPAHAADARQHPSGLRLRARAAHHAQVHRQQRRDRRHLGEVAGDAGAAAREAQQGAEEVLGGVGNPARGRTRSGRTLRRTLHAEWWEARIARQKEIDASIAAKAEFEYLYDKPYEDNRRVRVAGPFTVESLSPHRVLGVGRGRRADRRTAKPGADRMTAGAAQDFAEMILENLKTAGRAAGAQGRPHHLHRAHAAGRASSSAPRARYLEGEERQQARAASSSARSSARSPGPIWSPPRARRAMPASTC